MLEITEKHLSYFSEVSFFVYILLLFFFSKDVLKSTSFRDLQIFVVFFCMLRSVSNFRSLRDDFSFEKKKISLKGERERLC